MNILFITIGRFESIESCSIYTDLLRCFRDNGHEIYAVAPYERRIKKKTALVDEKNAHVLHVKTGNVTGTSNLITKGLAQVTLEYNYIHAIKHFFSSVKFDVVLYSTPPISLCRVIKYIKKKYDARSFLLLKDIFPQNAVDLGMLEKRGVKGLLYRYFRFKEKRLYDISEYIGCMSQANVNYIKEHNPGMQSKNIMICPNAIEKKDKKIDAMVRKNIRNEYNIPLNKTVFIYGGNLGKPQGISYMIECLRKVKDIDNAYFVIAGNGSEFTRIQDYLLNDRPGNIQLLNMLPKDKYDSLVAACDIGLIFLDHRFTIPNFPSRLLSYMQAELPVLACTDPNSDIGSVIVEGGFGWWCESNDVNKFANLVRDITDIQCFNNMKEKEKEYLEKYYTVDSVYKTIMDALNIADMR